MNLGSRRYLVTGGAGFIGSHIVDALVLRGDQVRVLDDFSTGHDKNLVASRLHAEVIHGSILDMDVLVDAVKGCAGIFHLAAVVSVPRSITEPRFVHDVNSTGTLQVLEAARTEGAKVVLSSSAAVYGQPATSVLTEDTPTKPISPYGVQKLSLEGYAQSYSELFGISIANLRYFNVYGPRQDPTSPYSGVISIFLDRIRSGLPLTIFGDGLQTRDFVYVEDVVRANLLAMGTSRPSLTLNVGTGRSSTLNELVEALFEVTGNRVDVNYEATRAGDIRESVCSIELINEALGFEPEIDLKTGLARTFASL